jgi:hypothetical protein
MIVTDPSSIRRHPSHLPDIRAGTPASGQNVEKEASCPNRAFTRFSTPLL